MQVGDVVDVVAPGSGTKAQDLLLALEYLRSLGLKPRVPDDFLEEHNPFHSNSDPKRLAFLKDALTNKQSKAVWCLRGGYGSIRLIPQLLKLKKPAKKKLLIGYSDITSLHLFLNQKWKWPSLHGPLLENGKPGRLTEDSLKELKSVIFGEQDEVQEVIVPMNSAAHRMKNKVSSCTGGNLTTFARSNCRRRRNS